MSLIRHLSGVVGRLARRPALRRIGWGLADQILSSGTNFAVALIIVRSVDARGFGIFSLAFVTYLIMLGVSRSLFGEPYVVRFTGGQERIRGGSAENAVLGGALLTGLLSALALTCAAVVFYELRTALLAFAITIPGLLVQDAWRFLFFGSGRPAQAALNDFVWAVAQIGLVLTVMATVGPSVPLLILAWGMSGTMAAVFGFVQMKARPEFRRGIAWLARHRDIGLPHLGQFALTNGNDQLVVYGISAVAGLTTVGIIQAADVMVRPLNLAAIGVWIATFPEGVRLRDQSVRRLRLGMTAVTGTLTLVTLAFGILVLLIPDGLGGQLLGENWTLARPIIGFLLLQRLFLALAQGPRMGVLIIGAARRALRGQAFLAPVVLGSNLIGAALAGAQGAVMGGAAALLVAAGFWWWQFWVASRSYEPGDERPAD